MSSPTTFVIFYMRLIFLLFHWHKRYYLKVASKFKFKLIQYNDKNYNQNDDIINAINNGSTTYAYRWCSF